MQIPRTESKLNSVYMRVSRIYFCACLLWPNKGFWHEANVRLRDSAFVIKIPFFFVEAPSPTSQTFISVEKQLHFSHCGTLPLPSRAWRCNDMLMGFSEQAKYHKYLALLLFDSQQKKNFSPSSAREIASLHLNFPKRSEIPFQYLGVCSLLVCPKILQNMMGIYELSHSFTCSTSRSTVFPLQRIMKATDATDAWEGRKIEFPWRAETFSCSWCFPPYRKFLTASVKKLFS